MQLISDIFRKWYCAFHFFFFFFILFIFFFWPFIGLRIYGPFGLKNWGESRNAYINVICMAASHGFLQSCNLQSDFII